MKSKIIGTVSLNINTPDFNYGAMLHSWAFQKYLIKNKLCEHTEVIDYITPKLQGTHRKNPIIDNIKKLNFKGIAKNIVTFFPYRKRYKKFDRFVKNNMITSKKQYTQKELEQASLDYDTIICESDVIWSPGFFKGTFDRTFFLNLDSMKKMKKIAYSPSMADGTLTEEQKDEIKQLLSVIDYISCRETYQKNIVSNLTTKNVEHVLDPVMLLEAKDYDEITAERIIKDEYILLYLPVDNNKKLREAAVKYANERNLKILEISTKCLPQKEGKTLTSAGIEEFLSAIKYSKVIFTNSFHAICFALIYNKDFYAFSRGYFGKVKNICDISGLSERFFENDKFIELPSINYDLVNNNLIKLKEKSKKWINNALNS